MTPGTVMISSWLSLSLTFTTWTCSIFIGITVTRPTQATDRTKKDVFTIYWKERPKQIFRLNDRVDSFMIIRFTNFPSCTWLDKGHTEYNLSFLRFVIWRGAIIIVFKIFVFENVSLVVVVKSLISRFGFSKTGFLEQDASIFWQRENTQRSSNTVKQYDNRTKYQGCTFLNCIINPSIPRKKHLIKVAQNLKMVTVFQRLLIAVNICQTNQKG